MRSFIRLFAALLLALGALAASVGAFSEDQAVWETAPEKELAGIIQDLDFGSNTMIFQGLRIRMAPDVQVEIRGTYGAFTMLHVGMKARVTYRVISASEREAVRIEQLPDNMVFEDV